VPTPALAQVWQDGEGHVDRAPHHRVDGVLEVLEGHRLQRADLDDAGHGDDGLDRPDRGFHVLDQEADRLAVAHIADPALGHGGSAELSHRVVKVRLAASGDDDAAATSGELRGDDEAEAARAPDDDCNRLAGHGLSLPCRPLWCHGPGRRAFA
jgi:hypothetical protein